MWTYFVQCVKSTGFFFWSITCFIIFNTANFIDISFYFAMGHKIIIYFFVYNKARQKGATWFLMGAIWFFPTGCPMGNMIFLGVVKAWDDTYNHHGITALSVLLKYSRLRLTIVLYMQAKPFERTTKPMVASLKEVELLITYSLF